MICATTLPRALCLRASRLALAGSATWLCASGSRAHDGAGATLPPWRPNLWLTAALLAFALLFAVGHVRRARQHREGRAPHRREAWAFALCIATLMIALLSPLDRLSDLTFSAHMTQHELLMVLAAPLLVLARPLETYLWVLPIGQRRSLAAGRGPHVFFTLVDMLTAPVLALSLHGVVRWLWHLPVLFEAALRDEWVHGVQHASFFFSAVLFWWGVVYGRYGRSGYGMASLFVMFTGLHSGGLGALLAFADGVWYPLYALRARAAQIDALDDQQLAGLVMWVGAGLWLMFLALGLFLAWLGEARVRVVRGQVAASLHAQRAGEVAP
jgi:putative membrane protein